jgi:hypothetical protein
MVSTDNTNCDDGSSFDGFVNEDSGVVCDNRLPRIWKTTSAVLFSE